MTLSASLRLNASFFTNLDQFSGPCLVSDSESLSYFELESRVEAQSHAIKDQCINEQQQACLAALVFETSIDAVVNYLAALRAQVPLLVIDPELSVADKQKLFQRLGVSVVLSGRAIMQVARWPFTELQIRDSNSEVYPALLLSTSGSSGNPKSVMLSAENLIANTRSIVDFLSIQESDVAITTLPLHYSYGLSVLNTHLAVGAKIVLTQAPMMSKEFWHEVREQGVTSISGVPFHYQMMQMLRIERMELKSIRCLTQAGGKLSPDSVEHFAKISKERGWQFFVMYGQTEATARMAFVPPELIAENPDCIGQAIPGGKFEIHSVENDELISEANQEGELWYYGENVMLGYAERASDWQRGMLPHKALATGDLAMWSERGLLRITGRLSRFIKIRGKRVQLDHVERQLQKLEPQIHCCGKDEMLYVVNAHNEDDVTIYLRDSLHLHPSLFALVQIENLPLLSNGKLEQKALLQLCEREL